MSSEPAAGAEAGARRMGYDPSARMTPANLLTLARLVLSLPWLVLVYRGGASWATFALGFVLAITDFVDGWLARRQGTTTSGAFLDPLADKVLVLGGLWALVAYERFAVVPVLLITGRELAISAWRSWLSRAKGVSVPAKRWAKVKTVIQEFAIGAALLPPLEGDLDPVADGLLWLAVALTLATGVDYLLDGRKVLASGRR